MVDTTISVDLDTGNVVEELDNVADAFRDAADTLRDEDDEYELNVEEYDPLDCSTWGFGRMQGDNLVEHMKENPHVEESSTGGYLVQRKTDGRIVLYEAIDVVEGENDGS